MSPLPSLAVVLTKYDPVIGLEVHVELGTRTKMFCGCATEFGAPPNTQVCPVCLALPGSLPVVNSAAIEAAIRIGLALNCDIAEWCRFARKNYFYPDMPKDYQISQYDEPLCTDGYLDVPIPGGDPVRVEIERVHMEEDTGKLTHSGATGRIHGSDFSLVDYNRAGIPLVEIVTKPVVGMGELAPVVGRAYVGALRDTVGALGVSDVKMEEGSLRCDANVSIALPGADWGTRSETKNVNSLRSVERAITYEIRRQAQVLGSGQRVVQETRHFQEDDGSTRPGRSKEQAEDYRYFPEPDLMPVAPAREWVEELRQTLPQSPVERRAQLQAEWGLSDHDMDSVVNAGAVDLVVETIAAGASDAAARKWWLGELSRVANEQGVELTAVSVTPAQLARVEELISAGELNDKLGREVVGELATNSEPGEVAQVDEVIAAKGLRLVSDDSALTAAVADAIAAMPEVVAKIEGGKPQAAGAIIGAVMKATKGQADAARVREILAEQLGL